MRHSTEPAAPEELTSKGKQSVNHPSVSKIQDAFTEKFVQGSTLHHFLEVEEIRYAWAQDSFLSADPGHTLGNKHLRNPCKQAVCLEAGRAARDPKVLTESLAADAEDSFCPPPLSKDPFPFRTRGRRFNPAVLQAPWQQLFLPKPTPREQADRFQVYHPLPTLVK